MTDDAFSYTPKQQEILRTVLATNARHVLLYGGSRSGKTFLFCAAIATRAILAPGSRHLILRKFAVNAVESIAMDTMPTVFRLIFPDVGVNWIERHNFFEIDTGARKSEIWIGGLDDKVRADKILGKEYSTIYANEASEISYHIHTHLMSRLAQNVRMASEVASAGLTYLPQRYFADLNPTGRRHWTYRLWTDNVEPVTGRSLDARDYAVGQMNPRDNPLLADSYVSTLENLPPEQRRRFLLGEYGADAPNALWQRDMIKYAPKPEEVIPRLKRIAVSIDPAVSTEVGSDETGIVVVGVDEDDRGYVLDDLSGKFAPNDWARRAVLAYAEWNADVIIAESNQGGAMVEQVIRQHKSTFTDAQLSRIPVKLVSAWKGKALRAEPVAALYAGDKVRHLRVLDALEEQMCAFTPDYDRKKTGESPDRLDAMVHGFTHLFPHLSSQRKRDHRRATVVSSTEWM